MTAEEMKSALPPILDIPTCKLHLVLKVNGIFQIKVADLENEYTQTELASIFCEFINREIVENEELQVCKLSTDDDRANAIYEYDMDEYPEELELINDFKIVDPDTSDEHTLEYEVFNFQRDDLRNLFGFIIHLGSMEHSVTLFKKFYPIFLIKRGSFFLRKSDQRFMKADIDDMMRLNGTVEIIKLQGKMYVLDIKMIEKNLGFSALVARDAGLLIEKIQELDIVEDIETLHDLDSPADLRRLAKAFKGSPAIRLGLNRDDILNFIKSKELLKVKFKYTEDEQQLRLDTKKAKRELIKILSDSFLTSELTDVLYDVKTKDAVDD